VTAPRSIADALAEIRLLQATYNLNGDRLRLDALAGTFAADGVLETPAATYTGRDAIRAGLGSGRAAPTDYATPHTFTRHHLTTSDVQLTGAHSAAGRTYFQVYTDIGLDHLGFYDDELVRENGAWRFSRRRVRLDWVSEQTLTPRLLTAHRERLESRK
jgi:hypothetical protein